jgi:hypothetical protein
MTGEDRKTSGKGVRRALAAGLIAATAASGATLVVERASASPNDEVVPLVVGDIARVTGAPLGCIVRFKDGERALDCRKIGTLRGSYGVILSRKQVLVVRFQSRAAAKIVFSAHHDRQHVNRCS